MADESFSPTFLRSATAFGVSTRLRGDLVVNNLVGYAVTSGQVLIKSDGMPWRPLVHIEDISRAFVAVLEAPRELVHNESFNVGQTAENYRVREIAEMVAQVVPNSTVTFAGDASPDARNYRVNCDKIQSVLPGFRPQWTARKGAQELYDAYRAAGLAERDLKDGRYFRINMIQRLLKSGHLDSSLHWSVTAPPGAKVTAGVR